MGGIGVFLLALDMLTQGLRQAGSGALQSLLSRWTDTPQRGLLLGFVATVVLQSSTVVITIIIGLVNAALMPLGNAIWTVFGANIGTTVTGWLVSATGLDVNLKTLALPFVGVGMMLKMLARRNGLRAAGLALTGIGLFFIGIDFLKDAFSHFSATRDLAAIDQKGGLSLLSLIGAGIVMTIVIQSSTATMVIILTSAASGMVTLSGGAALVIGANLGTTSTAIIAAIGASANARRTCSVHVLFNLVTAFFVTLTLPFILGAIQKAVALAGLAGNVPVSLAVFHTVFSVIGVILFWPFVPALTRFLEKRFVTGESREGQAQYLDKSALALPAVAIGLAARELARLQGRTAALNLAVLDGTERHLARRRDALLDLSRQIAAFSTAMAQENMASLTAENLQTAFKINRHLAQALTLSTNVAALRPLLVAPPLDERSAATLGKLMQRIRRLLVKAAEGEHLGPRARQHLLRDYRAAKDALTEAGIHKRLPAEKLSALLDGLSQTHRMAEQIIRADKNLAQLRPQAEAQVTPSAVQAAAAA